ncbi:MAG: farnesyl diphosphate synthase [Bacillota bacterium]
MSELKQEMERFQVEIEDALEQCLPPQLAFPPVIFEAMRYSAKAGGKRLRPMLLLSACNAVSGSHKKAMPFACAVEMIHTYSLIHDDLPALDNDDFRRGLLTCHKVFGENMAILAGDGLFSFAVELMTDTCCQKEDVEALRFLKAMQTILKGIGIQGMLVGQVADVYYEGKEMERQILDYIHLHKTADFIAVSLKAGAILGGADEKVQEEFRLAGEKMGIAFQIVDDILDVTSTLEVLGKPIGSDEKNDKTTYVTMFGVEPSKKYVKKLTGEAKVHLQATGMQTEFLEELAQYLMTRIH